MPQNRIICIVGPKGSGKTHDAAQYIASQKRVAVYDYTYSVDFAMAATEISYGNPALMAETLMQEDEFRLIYRPNLFPQEEDELPPSFEMFCRLCCARRDMTIVVDEAHHLCTARKCPQILFKVATLGRNVGVSLVFIAQRPSMVARILTANADEFWIWRTNEPADLDVIRQRCGEEAMERAANLRKLELTPEGEFIRAGETLRWTVEGGMEESASEDVIEDDATGFK